MIRPLLFKLFRRIITIVISFLLSNNIIITTPLQAQEWIDNDDLVIVKMRGGKERLGIIQKEDDVKILLQELNKDTVSIEWADMKSVRAAGRVRLVNGKFWYENQYAANYFLGPSAIGLNKGEGFYHNGLVLGNQVQYGLSNRLSIRVFVAPFTILDRYSDSPVVINPQLRISNQSGKANVAVGFMYATSIPDGIDNGENYIIPYGIITLGSKDRNVSFTLGYLHDAFYNEDYLIPKIDVMFRVSPRLYVITENYIIWDLYYLDYWSGLFSVGIRSAGRRIAFDFGVGAAMDDILGNPYVTPIPWVGLTIPFGRW
ncbi:MAG: hypothetical protein ACK4TA_20850 [Saprospiraceae bacterium]